MSKHGTHEKRSSNRVSILQEALFDGGKSHRATNVSEGGLFVATPESFYLEGSVLDLKFKLEGQDAPISTRAEVVHVVEGKGMGLRFLNLAPEDKERIRRYIERHSK